MALLVGISALPDLVCLKVRHSVHKVVDTGHLGISGVEPSWDILPPLSHW
jgi:hypothetical protein